MVHYLEEQSTSDDDSRLPAAGELSSYDVNIALVKIKRAKNQPPILSSPPITHGSVVRLSTPAYCTLGRKRSLTILSPQQISTRSTRELKSLEASRVFFIMPPSPMRPLSLATRKQQKMILNLIFSFLTS